MVVVQVLTYYEEEEGEESWERRFLVARFYKAGGRNKLKIKSTEEGQASRHCINKLHERPVRGSSFASPLDG